VIWKIRKKPRAIRISPKRNRRRTGTEQRNPEYRDHHASQGAIAKSPFKKPGAVFRPGSIKVPVSTFLYESRNKSNEIFTPQS
jgi:hypothetical protein